MHISVSSSILVMMTGEPEQLERLRVPTLEQEKATFSESIIGQEDAVNSFAHVLANLHSGLKPIKPGPLDILFLAGPSGVGKTEITLTLAKLLSNNEAGADKKVMVINGGEYQEAHYTARLFGSPPGYVGSRGSGSEIPPVLSQKNLENHKINFKDRNGKTRDVTIILIDEAEKANDAVHKAFLSILDKGRLEMADSSMTDFSDTIIVFTSNIGNQQIDRMLNGKNPISLDEEEKRRITVEAIGDKYPPELRGRMKKFVIFKNLTEEAIQGIAMKQVGEAEKTFLANRVNVALEISPAALNYLSAKGYSTSEGARAMGKVVTEKIYEPLVLIHGDLGLNGKQIYIDLDGEELAFYFNAQSEPLPEVVEPGQLDSEANKEPKIDSYLLEKLMAPFLKSKDVKVKGEPLERIDKQLGQYYEQISKMVSAGLVESEVVDAAMKNNPAIREWAFRLALECFGPNLHELRMAKMSLGSFISLDEINTNPAILAKAKDLLSDLLSEGGVSPFNSLRDRFSTEGIGTQKYWNDQFKDRLLAAI